MKWPSAYAKIYTIFFSKCAKITSWNHCGLTPCVSTSPTSQSAIIKFSKWDQSTGMHEQWSRGWVKVTLGLPNLCNSPEASRKRLQKTADRLGTNKSANSKILFYLTVHRRRWEFAEFFHSVVTFCNLKYFTRTWIVQEVLLAPTVHIAVYGDISVA